MNSNINLAPILLMAACARLTGLSDGGCPPVAPRSVQEALEIQSASNKGVCPQRDPRTGRLVFTAKTAPNSNYKPLLTPADPTSAPRMPSAAMGDAAGRWDVQCGAVPPCGVLLIWKVIGPSKPLLNLRGNKVTDPLQTVLTFTSSAHGGAGVRGGDVLSFGNDNEPLDLRRQFPQVGPGRYLVNLGDTKLILVVQGDELMLHADYDEPEDPSCPGHVNQMDYVCYGKRAGR